VIIVSGPVACVWDSKVDHYHSVIAPNGKKCSDTKREHEKMYHKAKGERKYYKIVLPPQCKIDNFLCSADYEKIDAVRVALQDGALSTGCVSWVAAFAVEEDSKSKDKDDHVDVEDLLRSMKI
jgi:hypothetical protein